MIGRSDGGGVGTRNGVGGSDGGHGIVGENSVGRAVIGEGFPSTVSRLAPGAAAAAGVVPVVALGRLRRRQVLRQLPTTHPAAERDPPLPKSARSRLLPPAYFSLSLMGFLIVAGHRSDAGDPRSTDGDGKDVGFRRSREGSEDGLIGGQDCGGVLSAVEKTGKPGRTRVRITGITI